ncbi:epoxide hydrolase family protein [Actinotalea caeni]|uniref:epoxide hydrolase family protein n=1 Tax=Actinotalea caeni TaxID=1348467 RepID=UPI001F034876|nr:epoxide hydrolase family protein [Actinotalea caeni]
MTLQEFRVDVPDAALDDLRQRVERTRWPDLPDVGWQRGVPVAYLREVADHWAHRYDWRTWQTRLSEHPQLLTTLDGQPIHALHVRSPEPDALPLVVTHGWPGSVVEMLDVVGPLADPRRHGGDPADAFHVVVPSLPGFGFSTPLRETGWGHARIARAWAELMTRLGYQRFGAMGGDTGSIVSPELGRLAPDRVVGVHVHGGLARPALLPDDVAALTPRERERLAVTERIWRDGTAYAAIQGTRPHTLAPALTDSPVGLLAWMLEKFWDWTDPAAPLPHDAVDLDHLLTDVTLYWVTGCAGSAAQLYYEVRATEQGPRPRSTVPTGVAVFPTDPAIRRVVEREHHVVHWTEHDRGGHFAAVEAPDLLVDDVRAFFRGLRENAGLRRP